MSEKSNNPGNNNDEPNPDDLANRSSSDKGLKALNEEVLKNKALIEDLNRRELYPNRIFWFMVFCTIIVFSVIILSALKIDFYSPYVEFSCDFFFFSLLILSNIFSIYLFLLGFARLCKDIRKKMLSRKPRITPFSYSLLRFFSTSGWYSLGGLFIFFSSIYILYIFEYVEIKFTLEPMVQSTMIGSFFVSLFGMMMVVLKGIFSENPEEKNNKQKNNRINIY